MAHGIGHVRKRAFAAAVALALGVLGIAATPATAAETPTTVATGFDNPRMLAFGPNGQLLVAEAGRGGDTCLDAEDCVGLTSKITAVSIGTGAKHTVLDGLVSLSGRDGSFAVGADGVSFINHPAHPSWRGTGSLFVQMCCNTAGVPSGNSPLLNAARAQLGHLLRVDPSGSYQAVASVGDADRQWTADHRSLDPNNPEWPDANPYGILAVPGRIYVADAGSNTLDVVRPDGSLNQVAWFPNPAPATLSDAVPTCVAQTSNGTIYVGDLNGRLWEYTGSFTPQQVTLSGDPVSSIESCATDGTDLFVTDIFAGNIDRIARSGAVQTLTTGLNFPGGVTVGPNNTLYFTNNSTFADSGEVLKLAL